MLSFFFPCSGHPPGLDHAVWDAEHLKKKKKSATHSWQILKAETCLLPAAAFAGQLYLRELDLSNNSLHNFQYGVLEDLYFLRKLSLGDNPWVCDYNIHYLIYWLKHHPGVQYSGLTCAEPAEFKGWRVEDYVKTYNGECPKDRQTGGIDMGQGGLGGTDNEAQEVVGDTVETSNGPLPRPLQRKRLNGIEVFRLS